MVMLKTARVEPLKTIQTAPTIQIPLVMIQTARVVIRIALDSVLCSVGSGHRDGLRDAHSRETFVFLMETAMPNAHRDGLHVHVHVLFQGHLCSPNQVPSSETLFWLNIVDMMS